MPRSTSDNPCHPSTRYIIARGAPGFVRIVLLGLFVVVTVDDSRADESESARVRARHQVTGMFSPQRVDDLRKLCAQFDEIKLIEVDFDQGEATFEYDPARAFPQARPEQIVERLDNLLRQASRHTFGAKPLRAAPLEKLTRVEIRIAGLDCRACELAVYEMVYRLPGVEMATASFREKRLVAHVHEDQIDRTRLEAVLRERGVTLE